MKKFLFSLLLFFIFHEMVNSACVPQKTTMYLPHGGKKLYTQYMQGELNAKIPKNIEKDSPIVASVASFPDGNYIIGGVLKSDNQEFNPIFFWVFNQQGQQYSDWPIDVSDFEDFDVGLMEFELNGCPYVFEIKERTNIVA